ncbi:OmpA family protein [Elizabethkingia meningoseptica]|uniref:OmpA family protein n=1 Tax=Elizabethkingia meningoseptica TaxID=238 RepID=UPI002012C93C|nr:OmpA family protein [Elizabethkingia meningoseptica]MCL1677248.1 OmpA family protein [Elizabethkingia meningoseptica]MCL1687473.1 OmpA family protein [Elizabethkingia meningoseptica]
MKVNFTSVALALILPVTIYAQDSVKEKKQLSGAYGSGSSHVSPFTSTAKKFNDWSVSAGAGTVALFSGSLYSLHDEEGSRNLFGWSAYFSVDKAISHAFGLKLQYDKGETRQGWVNTKDHIASNAPGGRTQYDALAIVGDVNLSNLFRRIDNHSSYRWAIHIHGGLGTIAYRSYIQEPGAYNQSLSNEVKPFKLNSSYAILGGALKYRLNHSFDLEGRIQYSMMGGKRFDGARGVYIDVAKSGSTSIMSATLGVTYNIGKHPSHLFWHDPLQEIYSRLEDLENKEPADIEVCKKGDADNDGVCDDWDRELNTPAGARVDGSGRALDTDLDGVIDLYDKCVTVPGPPENHGCPIKKDNHQIAIEVENELKNVYFEFNSSRITGGSSSKLDTAARIIKENGGTFLLTGHTDAKGSAAYNLKLSRERAAAVVIALESRGVPYSALKSKGVGAADANVPAAASDAERMADRKVTVRFIEGPEWESLQKKDYQDPVKKTGKKKVIKSGKKKR